VLLLISKFHPPHKETTTMKFTAPQIALHLQLRQAPFIDRKTRKDDPKRVVLKAAKNSNGSQQLGVFRKLTGLSPTKVKQGQTSIIAIFTSATFFKAKVEIPTVKLS
jgi:hypothetical protein